MAGTIATLILLIIELVILFSGITLFYDKSNLLCKIKMLINDNIYLI